MWPLLSTAAGQFHAQDYYCNPYGLSLPWLGRRLVLVALMLMVLQLESFNPLPVSKIDHWSQFSASGDTRKAKNLFVHSDLRMLCILCNPSEITIDIISSKKNILYTNCVCMLSLGWRQMKSNTNINQSLTCAFDRNWQNILI